MRVLRIGSVGKDVYDWELFLTGQGYYLNEVNDTFTQETKDATKEFQKRYGLGQDGGVGPETMGQALMLGFSAMEDEADDHTSLNWPPKPAGYEPMPFQKKEQAYGQIKYEAAPVAGNPEAIKIVNSWQKDNLTSVEIPQLKGVQGAPGNCKIFWHKKGVEQIQGLFSDWGTAGLNHKVLTWGGSWVPRFVRGSRTTLSNHSQAIAFDINIQWNGLKMAPARAGQKGSIRELIPLAIKWGFYSGMWFERQDGMHFELCKTKEEL